MSDIKNNYTQLHWQRRSELFNLIFSRTNGEVYQGPFKGMKILPKFNWGDGDTLGKLLGLYENELFQALDYEIAIRKPRYIINVGCAEGFYGLGMARALPNSTAVLIDIEAKSIEIARENAQVNGLNNVHFFAASNIDIINSYLSKNEETFIFMDAEGAEYDLLDPTKLVNLDKTTIAVEVHDTNRIFNALVERFKDTHDIHMIKQGAKNPYLDIIADLDDYDKMILCCEGRGTTMYWFYMQPKENEGQV